MNYCIKIVSSITNSTNSLELSQNFCYSEIKKQLEEISKP